MFNTKSGLYTTLFICVLLAISTFLGLEKAPDAAINVFLAPEVLFSIGSFPVTNSFFWEIILALHPRTRPLCAVLAVTLFS